MHGSDLHTSAHTHKRARTHYVHMTAPNQKTKTITQSIVSHLAFDLRTSIDRFSLQSRECSVYRWRSGVTRWAGAKWQKSWLYERHQTHLMLYKQPIIQVSLKKEEEEEETVGCFLRAVETHADAQNQAHHIWGLEWESVTYVICEVSRRSREFFVVWFWAAIPFVNN